MVQNNAPRHLSPAFDVDCNFRKRRRQVDLIFAARLVVYLRRIDGKATMAEQRGAAFPGAVPSLNEIVQQKFEEAKKSNADRSDGGLWNDGANDSKIGEPQKKRAKVSGRSRRRSRRPLNRNDYNAIRKRLNKDNTAAEYVPVAERRRVVLTAPTSADIADYSKMSHKEQMAIAAYWSDYLMSCKDPEIPSDRIFPGKTKRERMLNRALWLNVNHHGGTEGQFALIDPDATHGQVKCVKCNAKFTVAYREQGLDRCKCDSLKQHKDTCSGMDEEHGCPKCKETWETLAPRLDGGHGGESAGRRSHVSKCRTEDKFDEILRAVAAYQLYFPDRAARNQVRFGQSGVSMTEVKRRHLELDEASRFENYKKFADSKFCKQIHSTLFVSLGYSESRGKGHREVGRRKEKLERMGIPFAK